jgi:transposase
LNLPGQIIVPAEHWLGSALHCSINWQCALVDHFPMAKPVQPVAKSGVFERIFKLLAEDHDNEYMMIDATIVRAHQHSAGARKKTASKPSAAPAAGRAPKSTRSPTR